MVDLRDVDTAANDLEGVTGLGLGTTRNVRRNSRPPPTQRPRPGANRATSDTRSSSITPSNA